MERSKINLGDNGPLSPGFERVLQRVFASDPGDAATWLLVNSKKGWDYETAELRLWASVLELAIKDLFEPVREIDQVEALQWIMGNRTDVGSFLFICDLFKFDPSAARAALLKKLHAEKPGKPKEDTCAKKNISTADSADALATQMARLVL